MKNLRNLGFSVGVAALAVIFLNASLSASSLPGREASSRNDDDVQLDTARVDSLPDPKSVVVACAPADTVIVPVVDEASDIKTAAFNGKSGAGASADPHPPTPTPDPSVAPVETEIRRVKLNTSSLSPKMDVAREIEKESKADPSRAHVFITAVLPNPEERGDELVEWLKADLDKNVLPDIPKNVFVLVTEGDSAAASALVFVGGKWITRNFVGYANLGDQKDKIINKLQQGGQNPALQAIPVIFSLK